ncbi:MAG: hypothetical protein K2N53_01885 [Clostridia bacterium]|nr:hypothetical protein [Clostridia bacterium]MDE7348393.1 hypothetical protein [Clostridia bacterium]
MPRVAKPKIDIPKDVFFRYTVNGRVLAKVVDGRLLCAHRVTTNTKAGIDSWQEFASIEEASKSLGVPPPKNFGCPIIDAEHPRIDWSTYRGGYYIPKKV